MGYEPAGLKRIVLLDDPTGGTIVTGGVIRPATPGEGFGIGALADALSRYAQVPAEVSANIPQGIEPGTAVIVPAPQLDRLLADLGQHGETALIAVVDVDRKSILNALAAEGVGAVVEHHQYWAWRTNERADASIFADVSVVPRLRRAVTVSPIGNGPFARIRINGGDLPGLLGDYLAAVV
jgi:hypothetical protein